MNLNELYQFAEQRKISIECYHFAECECMSVMLNDGCYIGINPFQIDTYADEKVKLAHEIGHCETGAFYNLYSPLDIREKHERRADKWAIKKLIPEDELQKACENGCMTRWELSEYFSVTEDFMQKVLDYYKK